MTDRHPRDIQEVNELCNRLHHWPMSQRDDRLSIGFLAVLLQEGYSIREGRHAIRMIDGTQARLYVAPSLECPGVVGITRTGSYTLEYFKGNAVAVQTVSALGENGWAPCVDYWHLAERFLKTRIADADVLLDVENKKTSLVG